MQCGVAGAESAEALLRDAGMQSAPDRDLADVRATGHSGIDRQLTDHLRLRGEAVGFALRKRLGDIEGKEFSQLQPKASNAAEGYNFMVEHGDQARKENKAHFIPGINTY